VGFFLGGFLLHVAGYKPALWIMAGALAVVWAGSWVSLPPDLGRAKSKVKFTQLLSKSREINLLSAARLFLFGARDIWFVVGVPVFLRGNLGWSFSEVGSFMALWVIGYGIVQSGAPLLFRGRMPAGPTAASLAWLLSGVTALIPLGLSTGLAAEPVILTGLALFGIVFAINSAVHSYLVLDYTDGDKVALNVGFYYMANAGGRLVGCLLSGVLYQMFGLPGCLWGACAFVILAALISLRLPQRVLHPGLLAAATVKVDGD
jgi:predicted MFS family arabinose efflux permease